jgi:T5orf172 domain
MADLNDDELLAELGVTIEPRKEGGRSHEEARVIAGFEEINKFVDEHGRPPGHGEDKDIFERLYAVRLGRLQAMPDYRAMLVGLDKHGLLPVGGPEDNAPEADLDDAALLDELGVEDAGDSISALEHVKPRAEIRAAEDIANRIICKDFKQFKPLFAQIQADLDAGLRETRRFKKHASIAQGEFFVLGGQTVYVADVGKEFVTDYDRRDSRLRVIYDNGTESDILLRSLQRALNKDDTGRRVTDPSAGPLFGSKQDDQDTESGTIYVLRSVSEHPDIAPNRQLIHKIGVTGGEVSARIAGAELESTYLFAGVEVIATYKLFNINRSKLENLLHRFFAPARLDLQIDDRFGRPVRPREWFLVPLSVIDEVVDRVRDKTITGYMYDPATASLKKVD